jgi:hypothetical protein
MMHLTDITVEDALHASIGDKRPKGRRQAKAKHGKGQTKRSQEQYGFSSITI